MPKPEDLLAWPVAIYLASVILGQVALALYRRHAAATRAERRHRAGLDDRVLVDHSVKLEAIRHRALVDAAVLLATVVLVPILLAEYWPSENAAGALAVTFLALFIWALVSATDIAKAFLGGVAFRAYVGLRQPFQVGDRVTLKGHSGKVEEIDPFFVRISSLDDAQVSVPTAALWNEPMVSANAGERASLVVMSFHLAPFVTAQQRQASEHAIWGAIQRSVYWDFDRPLQIYVAQQRDAIVLTAEAYVASTYNESLFKSDVYRAFLDFAASEGVPLASTEPR